MKHDFALASAGSTKFDRQHLTGRVAESSAFHASEMKVAASMAIESMRENSKRILKYANTADQTLGNACIDAVKAIWEMMLNVLRFLARLFGAKLKERSDDHQLEDALANASVDNAALIAADIDKQADSANEVIAQAQELPAEDANDFMRALKFAGLLDADIALIDYASDPNSIGSVDSLNAVMQNSLVRVAKALDNLEGMSMSAAQERASAELFFRNDYEPPILTQDIVNLQRNALEKGLVPELHIDAVKRLIAADDAVRVIQAYRQTIVGSTMLVIAHAMNKNLSIEPYAKTLERIAGGNWADQLSNAQEMLVEPVSSHVFSQPAPLKSAIEVAAQSSKEMSDLDRVDADLTAKSVNAEAAKLQVNEFLAGIPGIIKSGGNNTSADSTGSQTGMSAAAIKLRRLNKESGPIDFMTDLNQSLPTDDNASDESPIQKN